MQNQRTARRLARAWWIIPTLILTGCPAPRGDGGLAVATARQEALFARQEACFEANLFYDDQGDCYSVDPVSLREEDRPKFRVAAPAPTASGTAKQVAAPAASSGGAVAQQAAGPQAPVRPGAPAAPAPSTPAGGAPAPSAPVAGSPSPSAPTSSAASPSAPVASSPNSSPPITRATAPPTTQGLPTINGGAKANWVLRVQSNNGNPPSALQGQVPLSFAVNGGDVSDGESFDGQSEMFNNTSGNFPSAQSADLSVEFTQGGILRGGASLSGALGGGPDRETITGTYRYTSAEIPSQSDTGSFTITRN